MLRSALEEILSPNPSGARDLADALFSEFGSLSEALAASPTRLAKVIGNEPARRLLSFKMLTQAVLAEAVKSRPWISVEEMASLVNFKIGHSSIEQAYVFYIDAAGCVIHSEVAGQGTTTSTLIDVRSLILNAVERGACALVIAHNHPSGVARPSVADLRLTERLRRMATDFDLRLIDHLIVARGRAYSIEQHRHFQCAAEGFGFEAWNEQRYAARGRQRR